MAAITIGKDHVCQTSLVLVITNFTGIFGGGFSLVQTKPKLESLNDQQWREDKINTESDMHEV